MKAVIFWGATGQAKVLREAMSSCDAQLVALFDSRLIASPFQDVPIYYGEAGFSQWEQEHQGPSAVHACVAIGGARGHDRLTRMRWLANRGYEPLSVVHPRSFVASDSQIGLGCQILAMSVVCTHVSLGDAVIVNTKASIDHDCVIGDGVHLAPGATLTGEVVVGDFAFIGAGSTVLPRIKIGKQAVVGAGAVVTDDVPDGETVIGIPARRYRGTNAEPG